MGAKELRREIIVRKGLLRRHSMNQKRLKLVSESMERNFRKLPTDIIVIPPARERKK